MDGRQTEFGSIPFRLFSLVTSLWFTDSASWPFFVTTNETKHKKRPSPLPIFMQNRSGDGSVALGTDPLPHPSPFTHLMRYLSSGQHLSGDSSVLNKSNNAKQTRRHPISHPCIQYPGNHQDPFILQAAQTGLAGLFVSDGLGRLVSSR